MPILTKYTLFIALYLCSYSSLAALDECKTPLKLSSTSQWYPYIYQDSHGNSAGVDVDLLSIILQRMGCQLEVVHFPERRALLELSRGRFDISLGASKTSTRMKTFFYSTSYRNEVNKFAYRMNDQDINDTTSFKEVLELKKVVAINYAGWYGEEIAKAKQQHPFFSFIPTVANRLKMLDVNRVDIVVDDEFVLCSELLRSAYEGIIIHPAILSEAPIHFIFNKTSVSLAFVAEFNKVLDSMKADGSLLAHYFQQLPLQCKNFNSESSHLEP